MNPFVFLNTVPPLTPRTSGRAGFHCVPSGHLQSHGWRSCPLVQKHQHRQAADRKAGPAPGHEAKQLPADVPDAPQPVPQPLSQPRAWTPPPPPSWAAPSPGLQPPVATASLSGRVGASAGRSGRLWGFLLRQPQPASLWSCVRLGRRAFKLTGPAQHPDRDHWGHRRATNRVHQQSAASAAVKLCWMSLIPLRREAFSV